MATERILIVDDEETLCEVLKINLENEGYDVDTAFKFYENEKEKTYFSCVVNGNDHTDLGE